MGGKASSLGFLLNAGLPVPEGFVVSLTALEECVDACGERELFERAARAEASGDSDRAAQLGQLASARLRQIPLPVSLVDALEEAHRDLLSRPLLVGQPQRAPGLLALRSSALGEDGDVFSHAGQYDSLLNLRGLDALLDGVRAVWASWYSERAIDYRVRSSLAAGRVSSRRDRELALPRMAVLVQRLVPARASGVMFTADPVTGALDEMTIEAAPGLGETLAQGKVHPDLFSLRRLDDGRVKLRRRAVGSKTLQTLAEPPGAGDVSVVPVPEKLRSKSSLSRAEIKRLAALGIEVEALLGKPVDIEWCVGPKGQLFLLQARPITAMRERRRSMSRPLRDRPVLWTQRFSGERWIEQATPLGWSMIQPVLHHFIEWADASDQFLEGSEPTRLFRGRPYFNVTIFRHLAFRLPGMAPPQFLLEMFPADEQDELLHEAPYLPNLGLVRVIFAEVFRSKRWRRYRWNVLRNHEDWAEFEPVFRREIDELSIRFAEPGEGLQAIDEAYGLMLRYMSIHLLSLLFAHLGYELLAKSLRGWWGVEGETIRSALVADLGENETLRANSALWRLADQLRDQEELRHQLQDPDQLALLLAGEREPTGEGACEAWGSFCESLERVLDEFGHRSSASYEIFATRWADDPELVVRLALACLSAPPEQHPARAAARREQERSRAESLVSARMGRGWRRRAFPWRQQIFSELLRLTRRYMALRENQRFAFDRLLLRTKRIFERIGAQLECDGRLEAGEDILFLTREELGELVSGVRSPSDTTRLVAARKVEFEANAQALHPDFLEGDEGLPGAEPFAGGQRLQGMGISPGRVTGTVRVIQSLDEIGRLQAGEVLVTRAVDPGWTPIFMSVSGLVLELGSMLSHGAVVAREYGLPAVVNIEGATRLLRDGQTVTIDGDRGILIAHRAPNGPERKERKLLDVDGDA